VTVFSLIPARGGSVSIPRKNLVKIGGMPLVGRSITYSSSVSSISQTWVSTDDPEIRDVSISYGAHVVDRPPSISGSEASSESALIHALDYWKAQGIEPSTLVFIQATSPVLDCQALERAIQIVESGQADVAFSAVVSHSFIWKFEGGQIVGVNHDSQKRERRQDRETEFRETGAFYVLNVTGFRNSKHRFFGRVLPVTTSFMSSFEIDEPEDLIWANRISDRLVPQGVGRIQAFVTDFDGVHTDDTALVSQDGVEFVQVSRSDGLGVNLLRESGIRMLILSREKNPVVQARARKLGVECIAGCDHKLEALLEWLTAEGIAPSQCAYVGNDLNDLECMRAVGLAMAPQSSPPEVLRSASVKLSHAPGVGLVREACGIVLEMNQSS